MLASNGHKWGKGKLVIDLGDADTTTQAFLDNWAKGIGYDVLSRNIKSSHALKGIFARNVATCCERINIIIYIYIYSCNVQASVGIYRRCNEGSAEEGLYARTYI